jgi:hypothetical protein
MRRHHFFLLVLAIIAALVAGMTFRARKAAGHGVDQYLLREERRTLEVRWVTHRLSAEPVRVSIDF